MGCLAWLLGNLLGISAAFPVISWFDGSIWGFFLGFAVYAIGYFVPFYLFGWLFPNFEI